MNISWFLIANPSAGNGHFSKKWKRIKQSLQSHNILFDFAFTNYATHEIELVQNAIQQGFTNIISVGGDGTLHNVVNGIMLQRYIKSSDITIGVIPLGTGNDWIKTYNITNNIEKAIDSIAKGKTILQDIGILETKNKKVCYFNNIAGIGYDGYIVSKLKRLKKLGAIAYLLSGLSGLLFYKKNTFQILIDNQQLKTKCLMTVIGICQFSGGGMQFTKNVNPSDGFFDITVAKNFTILELLFNLPKLYTGQIVTHKKIATCKAKEITIIPENNKTYIQADGELINTGKVTAKIIEKGIRFIIEFEK